MPLLWNPWDMPSGNGQPSQADKLWKQSQLEHATDPQEHWCVHCGRLLYGEETDYCPICTVDLSEERED